LPIHIAGLIRPDYDCLDGRESRAASKLLELGHHPAAVVGNACVLRIARERADEERILTPLYAVLPVAIEFSVHVSILIHYRACMQPAIGIGRLTRHISYTRKVAPELDYINCAVQARARGSIFARARQCRASAIAGFARNRAP